MLVYKAILFDMDGVITDTNQAVVAFWQEVAARHGVELSRTDFYEHIFGCHPDHTFETLFPRLTPAHRQAVMERMLEYETNLVYAPVPGIRPFLSRLKQAGLPTALVTSGDDLKVQTVLSQLELTDRFTEQVTRDDIRRGKPHPDCYLLAAERLGQAPAQCLVFEDALAGVRAAVAAGAFCIGVGPSPALSQAGAGTVIPDFTAVHLENGADGRLNLRLGAASVVLKI